MSFRWPLPGPCPQIAPKTKIFWKELQDKLDISMSWKRVCSIEVFIEKISPDDIPRDEVPIMEVVGPIQSAKTFGCINKKWWPPNICQKIAKTIYTTRSFVGNQPSQNPYWFISTCHIFSGFSRRSSRVGSTRGGKSKMPGLPGKWDGVEVSDPHLGPVFVFFWYHVNYGCSYE